MEIVAGFSLSKVLMAPRDRDKLCTMKVGTCLLGPVNPRSRADLTGRFCSILHNAWDEELPEPVLLIVLIF